MGNDKKLKLARENLAKRGKVIPEYKADIVEQTMNTAEEKEQAYQEALEISQRIIDKLENYAYRRNSN